MSTGSHKRHLRLSKVGLPPGYLDVSDKKSIKKAELSLIEFTERTFDEREIHNISEIADHSDAGRVRWLNIRGIHDTALIKELGEKLDLHPLALEDITTPDQRPRVEDYGGYLHIFVRVLRPAKGQGLITSEQLSIILGKFGVITIQETDSGDVLDPIRLRLRNGAGRIRAFPADYLAYRIVDAVIDGYFVILEDVSDRIDLIQNNVLDNPETDFIGGVHSLRRDLIFLKKTLWPLRSVIAGMRHSEGTLFSKATLVFLRDAAEHSEQVIESVMTMSDSLSSALEIYLTNASNRMNEIMRLLTVISTFFIPLTFIVGIYGMNFSKMPELEWKYGYTAVWIVMLATVICLALYFRKKKWF